MNVEALLQSIPPLLVYLVVGGVVGVESLGVPLPGEIVLVSAALMSSHHDLAVNPIGVGVAAVVVAVVCGVTAAILLRERTSRAIAELEAEHYRKSPAG